MRKFGTALLLWCSALALGGCVRTDFTPSSAARQVERPALTALAVLVKGDNLQTLLAAGGVVLGTLESNGAPAARIESVHQNAREDGAEEGGSHVVLVKTWTDGPARIANMKKVEVDETENVSKHGRYLVVRVKPERWGEIPAALRPVPLDKWKVVVAASVAAQKNKPVGAPVAASAVVGPSGPAPTGALGFVLGTPSSAASEHCVSLGATFKADSPRQVSCHGPIEAGLDVKATVVTLELCEGRTCRVAVTFPSEPSDAPILQERYSSVRARLLEKNGAVTAEVAAGPSSSWSWPDGSSVELALVKDPGGSPTSQLCVSYASAEGNRQIRAQGL